MAELNPKPNGNARDTMPAIGGLQRVRIPAGTRTLLVSSADPVWWEAPVPAGTAHGAGSTPANQILLPAGLTAIPLTGTGESDVPLPQTATETFAYFEASAVSQVLSVRASRVP